MSLFLSVHPSPFPYQIIHISGDIYARSQLHFPDDRTQTQGNGNPSQVETEASI